MHASFLEKSSGKSGGFFCCDCLIVVVIYQITRGRGPQAGEERSASSIKVKCFNQYTNENVYGLFSWHEESGRLCEVAHDSAYAAGICEAMRDIAEEKRQFLLLQRKWGSGVVKQGRSSKRVFDFNPKICAPVRGV